MYLVGGYRHADARPTAEDTPLRRSLRYRLCRLDGRIGIVAALRAAAAEIVDVVPARFKKRLDFLFRSKTAMIAAERHVHRITSLNLVSIPASI